MNSKKSNKASRPSRTLVVNWGENDIIVTNSGINNWERVKGRSNFIDIHLHTFPRKPEFNTSFPGSHRTGQRENRRMSSKIWVKWGGHLSVGHTWEQVIARRGMVTASVGRSEVYNPLNKGIRSLASCFLARA